MEPTDQPPPTPQTWAETSAWAPASESTEPGAPTAPAAWTPLPQAVAPPPTADDYVRPTTAALPGRRVKTRASDTWSPTRWIVIWALVAELVIIAVGCNQWVTKKATDYAGAVPLPGFAHQFVYSTQAFAWRVTKASGESTGVWTGSLLRIAVVLVLTGLLVAFLVRRGSFWRAGIATALAVIFSSQVAGIVGALTYQEAPFRGYVDYLPSTTESGFQGYSSTLSLSPTTGGGRATVALFGEPNGYRFVGGVILGVLVGIVVGIVARRFGDGEPELRTFTPPTPEAPPQTFFPSGEMQRGYEEAVGAPPRLAEPGAFAPPGEGGRHSRGELS
jgi:hypothetical protein